MIKTIPDGTNAVKSWAGVLSDLFRNGCCDGMECKSNDKNNPRRDGCCDCLGVGCCDISGMDAVTEWNAETITNKTPDGMGVVTAWAWGAVKLPEWML
jgi:hypothetical protein